MKKNNRNLRVNVRAAQQTIDKIKGLKSFNSSRNISLSDGDIIDILVSYSHTDKGWKEINDFICKNCKSVSREEFISSLSIN